MQPSNYRSTRGRYFGNSLRRGIPAPGSHLSRDTRFPTSSVRKGFFSRRRGIRKAPGWPSIGLKLLCRADMSRYPKPKPFVRLKATAVSPSTSVRTSGRWNKFGCVRSLSNHAGPLRDIELSAYFFPEERALATTYLAYAKKYLQLYEKATTAVSVQTLCHRGKFSPDRVCHADLHAARPGRRQTSVHRRNFAGP